MRFKPGSSSLWWPTIGLVASLVVATPSAINAQVMTFDGVPSVCPGGIAGLDGPLSEDGYTLSAASFQSQFAAVCTAATQGVAINFFSAVASLTQDGGGAFSIYSIDLASIFGGGMSVFFTGFLNGGGTVDTQFDIPAGASSFATYAFGAGWTDLLSVQWAQGADGNVAHQFDNISFSAPQETVPEPATMTLLASGLVALGAARRRRQSS